MHTNNFTVACITIYFQYIFFLLNFNEDEFMSERPILFELSYYTPKEANDTCYTGNKWIK